MIKKSAAIIIKNKSVLYLRKRGLLYWILPGGKIEKDETIKEALRREIKEELSAEIGILGKIGVIHGKTFNKNPEKPENIEMVLYRARLLGKPKISREIIDWTYIKHKNMHRYLLTPVGIKTLQLLHKRGLIE